MAGMSYPVKLQALPSSVFEKVVTPENMRVRSSVSSLTQLSFPKSRSALWDSTPAGEKLHLQLCSHRKLRLVLQEKTLRLAQRHARHSNKPRLHLFLLGSVSVDADEEGITVTLDRFDPGRDQAQSSGPVPSTALPGDVVVPCWLFDRPEPMPEAVIQSETDFHQCFKVLQHAVSSRQTLDLSQLLKVRAQIICSHHSDAAVFGLSWMAVCPAVSVDIHPVRPIPIIPTALLRSLSGAGRASQHSSQQRGYLTMDQTRKLILLLESDPKASSLPLVGLWISGITHVYNPQVWVWSLRFMFGSSFQDRVLSESGCFLLVVFGLTHRAPQFFQCRGSRTGPQLDCQILTSTQSVTLYQVTPADGRVLRCELGSEVDSRQAEVFRAAQRSFSSSPPPAAGLSVSDQDSGVEDEDLSPRPSPNPHPPAPQTRRVQPSVPELSLLVDGSFSFSQNQDSDSAPRPSPPDDKTTAPATSSLDSTPAPHFHSTPNSNFHQPCICCSTYAYSCTSIHPSSALPPAAPTPSHHQTSPKVPSAPSPSNLHQKPVSSASPHPVLQRPAVYQRTPPPMASNSPRPQSHHHTPPPNNHSAVPHKSSHFHSPPPPHHPPPGPSLLSSNQKALHLSPCPPPPPTSHPVFPSHSGPASSLPSSSCPNSIAPPSHSSPPSFCPAVPPPCHCCPPPPLSSPALGADPLSPPWLPRPPCVNRCCDLLTGVAPSDTYQLLLHQDRQLRLLQAQVQMLLEAQKKLQLNAQTSTSTASVAVETGASLFWGSGPEQPPPQQNDPPSSPPKPPTPPSTSSPPTSSHDPCERRPVVGAENDDITCQEAPSSSPVQPSLSGLQSPVLGESVSMYAPRDEQQSFYKNLMTQLHSRLQESDDMQEGEEDTKRKGQSSSDHSQSSSSASSSSTRRKKLQLPEGDPVVRATLRQLQQLGVDVDEADLMESEKNRLKAVESASVLASINPAAVVSRLSVSEPTASALCPGGSVDLSLEANAIALRYLSDAQLSRLSLGGHTPQHIPALSSSNVSLLSPSNMSLATRKYMRRYGLIEEDSEEEEENVRSQKVSARRPLTEVKLLPQSQLIRDLRPKMQLLTASKPNTDDKENCSGRRSSLIRAGNQQPEGSVGNILDLSRLRQLPKLF